MKQIVLHCQDGILHLEINSETEDFILDVSDKFGNQGNINCYLTKLSKSSFRKLAGIKIIKDLS